MGLSQLFQTAKKPAHVQQGVMHGTPATRHIHALAMGGAGKKKAATHRRRKSTPQATRAAPRRSKASRRTASAGHSGRRTRRSGVAPHMVKGSAAAKAHMAKLRKMVGRKRAA